MNHLPLRYRLRAMWYSAMILAFWWDETRVSENAKRLEQMIDFGTLHVKDADRDNDKEKALCSSKLN